MKVLARLAGGIDLRARIDRNARRLVRNVPLLRHLHALFVHEGMVPYSAKKSLDTLRRYECGDAA